MEQQQHQQGQTAQTDETEASNSQLPRSDNDDTWGLGSASALESLRRRNFRGRLSANAEDRSDEE